MNSRVSGRAGAWLVWAGTPREPNPSAKPGRRSRRSALSRIPNRPTCSSTRRAGEEARASLLLFVILFENGAPLVKPGEHGYRPIMATEDIAEPRHHLPYEQRLRD